jgi:hypothetical protein
MLKNLQILLRFAKNINNVLRLKQIITNNENNADFVASSQSHAPAHLQSNYGCLRNSKGRLEDSPKKSELNCMHIVFGLFFFVVRTIMIEKHAANDWLCVWGQPTNR